MIDLRVSPRTTPMDVKRQFQAAIEDLRTRCPELDMNFQMVLAIPGTSTPRESWIVQSCTRAWEAIEKRSHELAQNTSGATDANILRHRGIPTARIGMPKVADPEGNEVDFPMGMNAVDPRAMETLTHLLIRTVVDTCTRTRAEVASS
jgi:hypothetical protein